MADMPRMAFDRRSGRIILLATGPEVWETWAFDVCTNTWQQMRPERQPGPGEDGRFVIQLVYDADSDLTIGIFTDGSVWAYDDEADAWTEHGTTPEPGPFRLVYDPVSGLIVVQWIEDLHRALWTFDVETDSWTPITGPGAPPLGADRDHGLLAYDGSIDRLVAYNGLSYGTRLFDLRTGAWSATATFTPLVNTGWFASGGEIAYDEAREQTVVFSDGLVIAYRAREDRWEVLDGQPGSYPNSPTARMGHWMVYDSSNERLVVIGGGHRLSSGWVEADDVLGFDPTSREWIVLVEPLNVRPVDP